MNQIYANQTVSVTELKRNYAAIVKEAGGLAVAVLNNNRPESYLVPAEVYEQMVEYLEDLEDALTVIERSSEKAVTVNLDDLKNGL